MTRIEKTIQALESKKVRSAWDKGVKNYAIDLLQELQDCITEQGGEPKNVAELEEWLLSGAKDWGQYSWGGCALCYNHQIAKALCTPSELKRTKNGERKPNKHEEWLDVQARALNQAYRLILDNLF